MINPVARDRIEEEIEAEIADAFTFAEESAFPEAEDLYADVFK